jgi:hypothetical protein
LGLPGKGWLITETNFIIERIVRFVTYLRFFAQGMEDPLDLQDQAPQQQQKKAVR